MLFQALPGGPELLPFIIGDSIYRVGDYVESDEEMDRHPTRGRLFRRLPGPPAVNSLPDVVAACDWWLDRFFDDSVPAGGMGETAAALRPVASIVGLRKLDYLCGRYLYWLVEQVPLVRDAPPRPFAEEEVRRASSVPARVDLVKRLRQWAAAHSPPPKADPGERPADVTWGEAAERMERLRAQGEPFTSRQKLAERLGCSRATVHKAIEKTPSLRAWAKRPDAAPRAQSLSGGKRGQGDVSVVTDRTAQSRELGPEDEAAIREYLEREDLAPEVRAWFLALSPDDQLAVLDDPNRHRKILGRRP